MARRALESVPLIGLLAGCACGSSEGAPAAAGRDGAFQVEAVVRGLGPATDVAFLPDGRMVVTEKTGAVKIVSDGLAREVGRFPVDTESEKGLLGVAVDPAFSQTRRLFFYYSRADSAGGTDGDRNRVVSVRLEEGDQLDASTEAVLVDRLLGPANHDGGALAFGPDGHLYVGVGDSGCNSGRPPEPPAVPGNHFATCLTNANGKILRITPDGGVPPDNPLAELAEVTACGQTCRDAPAGLGPPRREIWAWGFRNPWRFTFDPVTGLLWVGDVGEVTFEEITIVERGRHHGWPWREGRHGWERGKCSETVPDARDCVEPVYECGRGGGVDGQCRSIIGGTFLDGPLWPAALRSRYVFADSGTARVWSVELTPDRRGVVPRSRRDLTATAGAPVSLRTGPDGAVYVVLLGGEILRIGPSP